MRNLITAGQITPGYVDERDIRDVKPDDLLEYGNAIVPVLAAEFIKAFMDFEREEEL